MTVPLVSFIIPAYNAAATIGATISGALDQTHPRVEVVVVDDGSTDETAALCLAYGDRIVYRRIENSGSSVARNTALELANGDFLAFLDADDIVLPPYLEAALATYDAAGGGHHLVMNEAYLLTATGLAHGRTLIGSRFPKPERQRMSILQKNFVPILSVFPRELYADVGGFDASLRFCEDWDFWLKAVLGGWQVAYQSVPHALYRIAPGAKSTHPDRHKAEDVIIERVRQDRWETLSEEERAFIELRRRTEGPRYLDLRAGLAVREGRWAEAQELYEQLAALSSEDPRTLLRARILSRVPLATRAWRLRQLRIDRAMGAPLPDSASSESPGQLVVEGSSIADKSSSGDHD